MKKEMLINVLQPEECRIAIIEDGVLEELYVERTSHESYTGNIYKGRIVNLEPAIQAAFVDFSVGRNGFLHVSDVEPQYFDRNPPGSDVPEAQDRERRRDRSRERDRERARDDRRRGTPPAPEPINPLPGLPPSAPPSMEVRSRERGRERDRDRERDRERSRERERPDQSIRGRRDRSEPPARRFGEGLIEPSEPEPQGLFEPASSQPTLPFVDESPESLDQQESASTPAWPVSDEGGWDEDLLRRSSEELLTGYSPDQGPEQERYSDPHPVLEERMEEPIGSIEPFDPDLPPSRTQRPRNSQRPGEVQNAERGRSRGSSQFPAEQDSTARSDRRTREPGAGGPPGREPKGGRSRGHAYSPAPPGRVVPPLTESEEGPFGAETPPLTGPDDRSWEPVIEDASQTEEPPRQRGGRAAIRSRGAQWDREGPSRSAPGSGRGQRSPGQADTEASPDTTPDRSGEADRRRGQSLSESARDRPRAHDRAGEPGYVPRRERLRTGDSAFGADIFPSGNEWGPDTGAEPAPEHEVDPRTTEFLEDEDSTSMGDAGALGAGRSDVRRRRSRRRGRRRDRPRPAPGSPAPSSPTDELDIEYGGLGFEVEQSRDFEGHLGAEEEVLGAFDDVEPVERGRTSRDAIDEDDFASTQRTAVARGAVEEEIDSELEQEIRREIDEIEELEREMGLRAPADGRTRRGDEPRGGAVGARARASQAADPGDLPSGG